MTRALAVWWEGAVAGSLTTREDVLAGLADRVAGRARHLATTV